MDLVQKQCQDGQGGHKNSAGCPQRKPYSRQDDTDHLQILAFTHPEVSSTHIWQKCGLKLLPVQQQQGL
jgi:hypothetical protein